MSTGQLDPDDDLRRRFDEREVLREAEEAAAQLERSTRTFRDVIDAAMLAGDAVELQVGAATVAGQVVGVSDSLVHVSDGDLIRYVNFAAVSCVGVTDAEDTRSQRAESANLTLLAFLRSLMSTPPDGAVTIVATSGDRWTGRVVGVAADHIELEDDDGNLRACRLANVAYVEH